ncbi:M48 family metallopeptidase [Persicobacter diffluens]
MIKFIFSASEKDNPQRIEIKEQDYPELFEFIRQLTRDTKTPFPKRIFLSPEVNAMVFYNSSFWSLFFPVRKNLEIGMGLVNAMTVSEFKAILAHEFGHFSQKSMAVGSYIYTVNRVIYDLVYEYDKWDNALARWAETGGIFGFFALVTSWFVEGVRSMLRFAYNIINKSYMKLSREMEYHADLIAVSVSGNEAFKNALRKTDFAAFTFDSTLEHLNLLAASDKFTRNIYLDHQFTHLFYAKYHQLLGDHGQVKIGEDALKNHMVQSRVEVKDQWASHPSHFEREENINKVNIEVPEISDSAWVLFRNSVDIQVKMTELLYTNSFPEKPMSIVSHEEYQHSFQLEIDKFNIQEEFKGFYGGRYLRKVEEDELEKTYSETTCLSFDKIYNLENGERIKYLQSNLSDLEILGQIRDKHIPNRYFDFDGEKYKRKEAKVLIENLERENEELQSWLDELDIAAVQYHLHQAKNLGQKEALWSKYQSYYFWTDTYTKLEEVIFKFQVLTNHIFATGRVNEEEERKYAAELSAIEKQMKNAIEILPANELIKELNWEEDQKFLAAYIKEDNYISKTSSLQEDDMVNLNQLLNILIATVGINTGLSLKRLTDFQLELENSRILK